MELRKIRGQTLPTGIIYDERSDPWKLIRQPGAESRCAQEIVKAQNTTKEKSVVPKKSPHTPISASRNPFFTPLRRRIYILIFFNILLYANTFFNRFTYDDMEYIVRNPYVQNPQRIFSLFTHPYPPHKPELALYRPLVELTYLLDWCRSLQPSEFSDLNFNDRVETPLFHLNNIVFHIGVALTIFFLVKRLYQSDTTAFITSLVFSAHPVHVETVTSLVGRAESMCALFFLLSLLLYIRERNKNTLSSPLLILSYALFFAALLSKESGITLPLVILATEWYIATIRESEGKSQNACEENGSIAPANAPGTFSPKTALIRILPYGAVFIGYLILRMNILKILGILQSGWYFYKETTMVRLAAMCVGALAYVRLLILPLCMSMDYNFPVRIWGPFWAKMPKGFLNGWVLLGIAFLILYALFTLWAIKRKKRISYPLVFIPLTMFPFSNIIPFGDLIAERFLYLPSFAFCLMIGIFFTALYQKSRQPRYILALLCLMLLVYSLRTYFRNGDWRSGITLWKAEFKQNPQNPNLYSGLGSEYAIARMVNLIRGNAFRVKGDFKNAAYHLDLAREYENKAIENYELAIDKNPKDYLTYYNYGGLSVEMREPDINRAEEILLIGAGCMPENLKSLYVFYYYLGLINLKFKPPREEKALEYFRKAHQLKKSENIVLTTMAGTLGGMGRYDESLALIRTVLARDPGNRDAVRSLKALRAELAKRKTPTRM